MHTAYLWTTCDSVIAAGARSLGPSPPAWWRPPWPRPDTQRTAPASARWAERADRTRRRRRWAWLLPAAATSAGWTRRCATRSRSLAATLRPRGSRCTSRPAGAATPSRQRFSPRPSASTDRRPRPATGCSRPVSPTTSAGSRSTSGPYQVPPGWTRTAWTTGCAGATRTNPGTSSSWRPQSASPVPRSSPTPELPSARRARERRLALGLQTFRVGLDVLDAAAHEERLLRILVELALGQAAERVDGLRQRDELARDAGELLSDEERLRQEPLDPPGPVDQDPVLLGQLVDAEDRDDVLQVLVALEDLLDPAGDVVVLVTEVARVEDPRRRVERVDRGVDAELGDRPGQHRRRIEVREGGVRCRVGDVVGGHVDRLQRRDRVTTRRRDALLQLAHLVGQRGLVTHGARHPAEQRRHLGTGLREPEDVVDEKQHVLLLLVAEVLRHRQRR